MQVICNAHIGLLHRLHQKFSDWRREDYEGNRHLVNRIIFNVDGLADWQVRIAEVIANKIVVLRPNHCEVISEAARCLA